MKKTGRILAFALMAVITFSTGLYPQNEGHIIRGAGIIEKITYRTSSRFSTINTGLEAIDSDRNSCWISTEGGPHWIEIDFGTKRIMTGIRVYPGRRDNYETIKGIVLQFKLNGAWFDFCRTTVDEREAGCARYIKKEGCFDISPGGIDASMFRIYIPDEYTRGGCAAIAEIEIYVGSNRLSFFDERLLGMIMPVTNGLLPDDDRYYPNAPRAYRGGTHAGLDILYYHSEKTYEKMPVTKKTPVLAAKSGTVIRADHSYAPMTKQEWLEQSRHSRTHPRTFVKHSFGGRQVWIDHGDGVVTTYNHLSHVAKFVKQGTKVKKGEVIGLAGNSGLLGEIEGRDDDVHLHFEIWIDGYYLGRGMETVEIKKYYSWIVLER